MRTTISRSGRQSRLYVVGAGGRILQRRADRDADLGPWMGVWGYEVDRLPLRYRALLLEFVVIYQPQAAISELLKL